MVEHLNIQSVLRRIPLIVPGLATFLMLMSNPITDWFFYVDPERGYVHGKMFIYTYIACAFYMLATLFITLKNRPKLRREEYSTIFRFLGIVFVSMVIQFLHPALLISGVAIALSVILMYFTIQNPETMLDTTTGAFTSEAMLAFLRDRVIEKEQVQLTAVKIQNMSRINELLGIGNGSVLLAQVSRFLRDGADDAWVFRMRGSCFVAITRKLEDYRRLSEKLDERIGLPWRVGNTEILLQATVCRIATRELQEGPISPEETVNYLETAILQSERSGSRIKNVTVGTELLDTIKRGREVETALREAIANGEGLELYFQPLWCVKRERFVSAEVLLRFFHPVMGFISPDEFVPIAESNGLVTAMDELVVRKTCAFIRDNNAHGELGLDTFEINLSALEFMHRQLPELLNDIMAQYETDPKLLCFEITETAATESFELLNECMTELSNAGCRFALDDFGTGYANISQVIQLPFSMVKLDKSLLYGPEAVLEDMVRMFNRIKRLTVIEGVETAEQAEFSKSVHVDYVQGFYYAKPMNERDFVDFLRKNAKS